MVMSTDSALGYCVPAPFKSVRLPWLRVSLNMSECTHALSQLSTCTLTALASQVFAITFYYLQVSTGMWERIEIQRHHYPCWMFRINSYISDAQGPTILGRS
jgi:hypothetical protein